MEYINIIVVLQIVFLFSILFFKNDNYLNKLLAIIILIPAASFTFNSLDILNILPNWLFGVLYFTIMITSLLFAPIIFHYVHLMCGSKVSLKHPLFIITALIISYDMYGLIHFSLFSNEAQSEYIRLIKSGDFPDEILIISLLFFVLQQVYFTFAAIKIYKFKKKANTILSHRSNLKIEFIQRFIILTWGANIISLVCYTILPMRFVEFVMLPLILFVITNFIFYYAFKYQAIFQEDTYRIFLKDIKLINSEPSDTKEENNSIKKTLHAKTIQDFLEDSKAYLNPDYTIYDLSKNLGCSYNEVSQIINKEIGINFSKLINNFRVEESKTVLKEKINNHTIEAIGMMSGFKSRASFYRSFKNSTGLTPSEYLNLDSN